MRIFFLNSKMLFVCIFTAFLFLVSCSSDDATEMEPQEMDQGDDDENPLPPLPTGDPDEISKSISLDFLLALNSVNYNAMIVTRQAYMFGSYDNAVNPITASRLWGVSYDLLKNTLLLEALNEQPEYDIPNHLGVAQVLQAYTFFALVDYMGDVPFTEANNVQFFPNPKTDSGLSIYNKHLALLDTAIENLNAASTTVPSDYFFESGFNKNNWITVANTLKIKAYTNLRLTDPTRATNGINTTLSSNIIDTQAEDFAYKFRDYQYFGNDGLRSPLFEGNYGPGGVLPGGYMSNSLYDMMNVGDANPPYIEDGTTDPRTRYYFYRQRDEDPNNQNLPCASNLDYTYCYVGNFYWGRDHGDNEGFPNDSFKKTTFGIYPAGGSFDNNQFRDSRDKVNSLDGRGIFPLLMSSHINFLLAETSLTIGTSGNTAAYLENGIRQSMEKVKSFGQEISTINPNTAEDYAITTLQTEAYVTEVINNFNASSNTEKLAIISREMYLASYGNGLESYNLYRRNGKPDFAPSFTQNAPFPRSFPYPFQYVDNNPNIDPKPITAQVFWDNNPAGFID